MYAPLDGGTKPRGPEGGIGGLVASDRCGTAAVGVWGCFDTEGAGDGADAFTLRLDADTVGGALRAAGPRGGDLTVVDMLSLGQDRVTSLAKAAPE